MSAGDAPAPDPRYLQANERTLLAWMRTALAFISFGFGLAQMEDWLSRAGHGEQGTTTLVAATFVLMGVAGEALAIVRYRRIRRALLTGHAVPVAAHALPALAILTALLGLALAVYILR